MSGSSFGTIFKVTTWGESHGRAIGAVIDGMPSGLELAEEDINKKMRLRAPMGDFASRRREADTVKILSGVFEGKTTGTPISLFIENTDAESCEYDEIKDLYRPSHADFVYDAKYGFRDYRGGGRSSGRETAARVAAGAVAELLLSKSGIIISAYVVSIGDVAVNRERLDLDEIWRNPLKMPDAEAAKKAEELISGTIASGDSIGGVVECRVSNVPAGLGEPVFDKLDAQLAKAVMSIGGIKGIEFGCGFEAARMKGSEHNDGLVSGKDGTIRKLTNHSGGITGGISDGGEIVFRAAVKPTPTISQEQKTVSRSGEEVSFKACGRHDGTIAPKAAAAIEAMTAIVLADMLLMQGRFGFLK